jgi:dipeptidyl aminopeptidase/acylaminoacyl peptidase
LHDLRALLELPQAWPLAFGADGAELLVASDLPGTRQLFLLSLDGGELAQLTDLPEPVDGRLLPDGRILLEIDEGGNERTQLYLLERGPAAPLAQPQPLVVDPRFNHWTPAVSRDGSLLAYATNRGNGRDFEVVVRRLGSGEETTFDLLGYLVVHGFSPDGRWIVVERISDRAGDSDLFLLDVESGEVVHATPHDGEAEYLTPSWLADSSGLYAATNAGGDALSLARHDLGSGAWEVVLESKWDLECAVDDAGRSLVVIANEDGWSRVELRDPGTLELRGEVPLPGRGLVAQPVFSHDGSQLAFAFSSPREPLQTYVFDLDSGELRRLTGRGPVEGVDPELHRFRSFDGEEIPVFLFEPAGEGPFPVVVTVHGGPESQWLPYFSQGFGPFTQFLVSRGYAVAAPNVRGSSGYGKRFEHLDDVALRLDAVRDLAELHSWLAARPTIDASRAVVYGRSYGGYMALAALAFQPELWAAGISFVGISNLVTFLENTSEYRRAAREREYGSLARDREVLERISPASRIDDIRAPLFLEHGRNDPRVPVGESEYIHRVLTEQGVRCELVVYEDEGHLLEKLPNRVDAFERAVAFLDEVLP